MRMAESKAKRILDFLAKRCGYEGAFVTSYDGTLAFAFSHEPGNGEEVLLKLDGSQLRRLKVQGFSWREILSWLIEYKQSTYVSTAFLADEDARCDRSLERHAPWLRVFKDSDTLATLAIAADLDA